MKRFVIHSMLFVILAYVISTVLSCGYTVLFARYKSDQSKKNWTLVRKGDTLDYIAVGSSRVFHMLDVPLLNTLTGKKGLNIGTAGSSYADNYALLVKYLEGNTARTVILNADELCFHSSTAYSYPFKDYENMPYFFEDTIREVYKDNVPAWKYYLWTGIPLSRYIEYNEHYEWSAMLMLNIQRPSCKLDTTAGTELLYDMGYKNFHAKDTLAVHQDTFHVEQCDERYLYKILSLCRAKKMRVILITTPLFEKGIYAPSNRLKFQRYIEQIASQEKLTYINFVDVTSLQDIKYFRDLTHTNIQGTDLYTRYLANRLKGQWN